ncbi:sugar nucleotide-binding protein, partial [bacterium]|nr:sugar nucleotide-binding protein [bacterium]
MILLLGTTGYVGTAYRRYLSHRGLACQQVSREETDYTDVDRLRTLLRRAKPEFVLNCAGYTGQPNVDACEDHKTECLAGNAVLPGTIRQACEQAGIPWGHISSGCIYNGTRPNGAGFREDDPPNFSFRSPPFSFYSGTKALGEELLAGAERCYIWRLRIPFNEVESPRNYLTKVMRYERLLDARNSLSQLDEFVRATIECWQRAVPYGTYNVTNPGSVTTREVVELIRQHGPVKKDFQFFADEAEFMRVAAKT